jgi:2-methylcitrate dehydratase
VWIRARLYGGFLRDPANPGARALIMSQLARTQQNLAQRLAGYAHDLHFEDIDAQSLEAARTLFIDSIGCAIASHHSPTVAKCRALVPGFPGPCTVLGTSARTTMDMAAFVNGAAVRYLDMNDTYMGPGDPGHPSDMLPACLAVAQAQGRTGEALVTAMVMAYEVNCRLLDGSVLLPHGWDFTYMTLPATALAAGKLMNLDAAQLTQAVNLALVAHLPILQTRAQHLSDWKGLADAQATRDAIFAAQLAQQGVSGPAPIFEGTFGVFRQLGAEFTIDVDGFGGRSGQFRINATSIKPYSAEWFALTAIRAAIDLAPQVDDLLDVEEIRVATTSRGYQFLAAEAEKWDPRSRDAADHSMPFIVARALLDRSITIGSYSPESIQDPRLQRLMAKVKVKEDPALTAMFPGKSPNRLTLRLKDGRVLQRQVDDLPGFAGRMMSRSEVEDKFRGNVAGLWSDDQSSRALESMWQLEKIQDVDALLARFIVYAS